MAEYSDHPHWPLLSLSFLSLHSYHIPDNSSHELSRDVVVEVTVAVRQGRWKVAGLNVVVCRELTQSSTPGDLKVCVRRRFVTGNVTALPDL